MTSSRKNKMRSRERPALAFGRQKPFATTALGRLFGVLTLCAITLEAAAANDDTCLVALQPKRLGIHAPKMSFHPQLFLKGWQTDSVAVRTDRHEGFAVVTNADGTAHVTFRTTAEKTCAIEQFVVSTALDLVSYAGGELQVDGTRHELPVEFGTLHVANGKARQLTLVTTDGDALEFRFAQPTRFVLQDDRAFGVSGFSLRLGLTDGRQITAGEEYAIAFTLASPRGIALGTPKPVVITADKDWIAYRPDVNVAPGSALDFSGLCGTNAPCGAYGRVIAVGEHFEFEKLPGIVQRFYGPNLCFTANFLEPAESRKLIENLRRVGYNAVRIHHHDGGLVQGMPDSTTLAPWAIDRLDALLAACSDAGIYVTTDLLVSRRVPYREVGIDKKGAAGEMTVKTLVRENPEMRENYFRFVRNWLGHVNPYTRRRWADEPALAWISFINEGNPGNPGCGASDRATLARELEMDRAIKALIRDELGSKALVTSMNGWSNVPGTALPRIEVYDYVDDHYYFDHPTYLNNNWSTPSRCSNILPFADSRLTAVNCRLFGKPFTISEFNYCYPSILRGCGGLVMGAMAALQDWGALWRFAWSHSAEGIRHYEARWSKFFDTSADPTELASERAALCLFRRGDLAPLTHTAAVQFSRDYLATDAAYGNRRYPCADLIWYRRLGIAVGDLPAGARALAVDDDTPANPAAGVTDEERRASPVRVDTKNGIFSVDTPRTQGAFLREGMIKLSGLTIGVKDCFATVWATSLDGQPLNASGRILVSHVTETVNSDCAFSDKTRTVMTDYGHVPHLMRRGRAACRLTVGAGDYRLYALGDDGRRVAELPCRREGDRLRFVMDVCAVPDTATCWYEIVRTTAANGGAFTPSQPDNGVNRITKEKP